jgi:hypothetical protein
VNRRLLAAFGLAAVAGLALIASWATGRFSSDDDPAWMEQARYRDYAARLSTTTLEPALQQRMVRTLYLLDQAVEEGYITEDFAHMGFNSILVDGPGHWMGTVVEASPDSLEFAVFSTGESVTVDLTGVTLVQRGLDPIAVQDLMLGELIEVIVRDGAEAAYLVRGFWAKP